MLVFSRKVQNSVTLRQEQPRDLRLIYKLSCYSLGNFLLFGFVQRNSDSTVNHADEKRTCHIISFMLPCKTHNTFHELNVFLMRQMKENLKIRNILFIENVDNVLKDKHRQSSLSMPTNNNYEKERKIFCKIN